MNRSVSLVQVARGVAASLVLAMLTILFAPAAQAAHVNSSATLGPSQTGDGDGTGMIEVTFDSATGEVCYDLTVANIDAPTVAHIHAGAAGATGGVVVDFGTPVVLGTNTCVMSTAAQVQEIVADPGSFYVNVHNAAFPAGAIRAQISAVTPTGAMTSVTTLAPTGDPAGSGSVTASFDAAAGMVCYSLTTAGLSSSITAAHIHIGAAGVNGGVLINLDYVDGQAEPKCVSASAADINTVLNDPDGHYINVHTSGAPSGAIRGQVGAPTMSQSSASFALDGLGFGDPDGSGTAEFTLFPDGSVCYTLTVANIEAPTAAHIHIGADGVQGGVLVDLAIAANGLMGCVQSTPAAVQAIIADPAGYYVNVHNGPHPAGAIRGQLTATAAAPETVAVDVPLLSTGDADGSGNALFNIDPATGRICFTLTVSNIDTITAAHIHRGVAGVDGPVEVDLDVAANGLDSCVFVPAATAMAIAADLGGFYVNVHTTTAPAGAVRAQLDGSVVAPAPTAPTPVAAAPLANPGAFTNPPTGTDGPVGPIAATTPANVGMTADAAPVDSNTSPGLAVTGYATAAFAAVAFGILGAGLTFAGTGRLQSLRDKAE